MTDHLKESQWYFPYYKIPDGKEEIVLREYDLAASALEADKRSLNLAAAIALFFSGSLATFISSGSGASTFRELAGQFDRKLELISIATIIIIAVFSLLYFAWLQRSATYASRKIVVLRRLLGLDYGHIESVLPSSRLDGANEPYSLLMFPGWHSLQALPATVVVMLAGSAVGIVVAGFEVVLGHPAIRFFHFELFGFEKGVACALLTISILLIAYRLMLFEDYETVRLRFGIFAAKLMGVPLKPRLGHVLYRLRLSVYEAERLGFRLDPFFPILVSIEDAQFYRHNGNSVRALLAAAYRLIVNRAASGGASTIYQQLIRSNLMTAFSATFRRKLLEWIIAPWANGEFTKADGLKCYLCSVRYANGVIGVVDAVKHYYPNQEAGQALSKAQMFLLIERLSMVGNYYKPKRVIAMINRLKDKKVLFTSDEKELMILYQDLCEKRILIKV